MGLPSAGAVVAELLHAEVKPELYRLVERGSFKRSLTEHGLNVADVIENPALLRERNIQGIDFVLIGRLAKEQNLLITASIVHIRTGEAAAIAEATALDAAGLEAAVQDLAAQLQQDNALRARSQRVAELLATALAHDSREKGKTALAALDELLKFDPAHAEARALQMESGTSPLHARGSRWISASGSSWNWY